MNLAMIHGRIGGPVEMKQAGQSLVAKFSVATSQKYMGKDGEQKEATQWHNIVCWGKLAEAASYQLDKGMEVFLFGRAESRSYEKKDGTKGYSHEIVAERVFVGLKPPQQGQQQPRQQAAPKPRGPEDDFGDIPF